MAQGSGEALRIRGSAGKGHEPRRHLMSRWEWMNYDSAYEAKGYQQTLVGSRRQFLGVGVGDGRTSGVDANADGATRVDLVRYTV